MVQALLLPAYQLTDSRVYKRPSVKTDNLENVAPKLRKGKTVNIQARKKGSKGEGKDRTRRSEKWVAWRQRHRLREYHTETSCVVETNPCKGLQCIIQSAFLSEEESRLSVC